MLQFWADLLPIARDLVAFAAFQQRPEAMSTEAWMNISEFTDAFKLDVAQDKSWFWSTDAHMRTRVLPQLRQGPQPSTVLAQAKDLGAGLIYTRMPNYQVLHQRVLDTLQALDHVGTLPLDRKTRSGLITRGAWPKLYACEVTPMPKADVTSLRAAAKRALGFPRPQCNPWLALNLATHSLNDPEFYIHRARILRLKSYLKKHARKIPNFWDMVQGYREQRGKPGHGPVKTVLATLDELKITPIHNDNGIELRTATAKNSPPGDR